MSHGMYAFISHPPFGRSCLVDTLSTCLETHNVAPFPYLSFPKRTRRVGVKGACTKLHDGAWGESRTPFPTPRLHRILDLIVLPTHSGPLFPSSAVVNYVHWKSIDSCSRSLGNVWTNEEERRSDLDCKKKGLGGGAVLHFVLHSLYSSSLWIQTCRSQMVKESHRRECDHSTLTASPSFPSSLICLAGSYLI